MPVVYAWPPVGAVMTEWSRVAPIAVSRSLITGKRHASSAQPERRVASLTVNALTTRSTSGAGYMEMLKRMLAGGENLVRLYSHPVNRHLDAVRENPARQSTLLGVTTVGTDADVTATAVAADVFAGNVLTATGSATGNDGFDVLTVSGFVPGALAARPGEFLTVFENNADTVGSTVQIVTEAVANGSGVAVIKVFTPPAFLGRVNIGVADTAIFEAETLPRSQQPVSGNWFYGWRFIEVFPEEIGSYTEVDPWA